MTGEGLNISVELAAAVLAHARAELPNEACGLLSGELATGRATNFHPARNAHASPLRYELHPDDLVRIIFAIEAAGEDLVAVFHSHTSTPAIPSATDLRSAEYPTVYLLASLEDPSAGPRAALRAWRIRSGEAVEVSLAVG